MWKCQHKKRSFVTATEYQGKPENLYSCQGCGVMISEIAGPKDEETYYEEKEEQE